MIRRFLDLSTAHLQPIDRVFLDRSVDPESNYGPLTMGYPYGWFVFAAEDRCEEVSDQLWAILQHARSQSCDYVMFDADAAVLDGFPVFRDEAAS